MKLLIQRFLTVFVLLLISSIGVKAQGLDIFEESPRFEGFNFSFTGNGARARGMGNAFIGVSDDITAIGWNPAGLYKMESPILGLTYTSLRPRGSSSTDRLSLSGPTPLIERISFDHAGSFGKLTSANFVAPLRIKGHPFVGSISYTRVSDEYQFDVMEFDIIEIIPIFNEVGVLIAQDTVVASIDMLSELQGGIDAVNIGFGTRVHGDLAFGAAVNIYTGAAQRQGDFLITGDNVPVNNFQHGTFSDAIITADSSTFSGFNFTLGLKHDGEYFDAGLVVRTPFSLGQNSLNFTSEIVKINDVVAGTDTTITIDLLTNYEMPLMIGFGIGYSVKDNWLLAFDAEYRSFSKKQVKIRQSVTLVPGADNIEEFTVLPEDQWQWRNVFVVRAGTEYLNETGIGTVPLRAGFGYVPVPTPDIDIGGNRSTAVSYEFSLGTGIHWEQIKFDLAYNYTTFNIESFSINQMDAKNHFVSASFTGFF
jgi:opacity protein-like surface antigen